MVCVDDEAFAAAVDVEGVGILVSCGPGGLPGTFALGDYFFFNGAQFF
jgi:hypothetical protein